MKKALCWVAFLVLAAQAPLWCYDQTPSNWQIVPECIWSPATGGGTWVTELQVLSFEPSTGLNVHFFNVDGHRGPFPLYGSFSFYSVIKWTNILQSIDALDSGTYNYYGKVGAVWFEALGTSAAIAVQASTYNGNYGKNFPSLSVVEANTAGVGRPMVLLNAMQSAKFRTFIGLFNTSDSTTFSLAIRIYTTGVTMIGSEIVKTMAPLSYVTFNPFVEAGVGSGTYTNAWIHVYVNSGDSTARAVMCFGSVANNYTNDTYALIARPYTP